MFICHKFIKSLFIKDRKYMKLGNIHRNIKTKMKVDVKHYNYRYQYYIYKMKNRILITRQIINIFALK